MRKLKPLMLDTLLEKQAIPFKRKGSRGEDTESFIVGGSMPKPLEPPKGTRKRTMKRSGSNPRAESARKYYKNKSDQNYKSDPDNR